CLWPSGISGSIAYNWSQLNMKTGVKIIHASGISGSIAYNWSWLNMKTGVKIIHASSPPPHSRVFDFVNFDLFAIFAIFIWIGVSVTQWYFGFNRLQLGIYSDAGNQTCSKRMPRSLGHEEKMQKHFLLGYI
ncbi:hypothetical protein D0Y65_048209, partial [Glycine soja]